MRKDIQKIISEWPPHIYHAFFENLEYWNFLTNGCWNNYGRELFVIKRDVFLNLIACFISDIADALLAESLLIKTDEKAKTPITPELYETRQTKVNAYFGKLKYIRNLFIHKNLFSFRTENPSFKEPMRVRTKQWGVLDNGSDNLTSMSNYISFSLGPVSTEGLFVPNTGKVGYVNIRGLMKAIYYEFFNFLEKEL